MSTDVSALRVAHVCSPAEFGGLERVVHALATGQQERGYEVCVIAILDAGREHDHPVVCELARDGVRIAPIALPPRAYREERRAVRKVFAMFRPDLVHTHGARVDVLTTPVARADGLPTISTVHGFTGGGPKNRLYELLQRLSLRRVDRVVAVSSPLARVLAASGVPASRITTIPNAWVASGSAWSREDARAALCLTTADGPLVGWVGRLTHEKGADVFLRAFAKLPSGAARAMVVGDGRERSSLERLAADLGIADRVTWLGTIRGAGRLLSAFDVFVMSSRTEGTPIVLFEAMSAHVPVVATAVGGVPDVVGPRAAMLVPSEDPGRLATAIRDTLENRVAALERARIAGTRLRQSFSSGPWLGRYDVLYRSLAARKGGNVSRDAVWTAGFDASPSQ